MPWLSGNLCDPRCKNASQVKRMYLLVGLCWDASGMEKLKGTEGFAALDWVQYFACEKRGAGKRVSLKEVAGKRPDIGWRNIWKETDRRILRNGQFGRGTDIHWKRCSYYVQDVLYDHGFLCQRIQVWWCEKALFIGELTDILSSQEKRQKMPDTFQGLDTMLLIFISMA